MKFVFCGGLIKSVNDNDFHYVSPSRCKESFLNSLENFKVKHNYYDVVETEDKNKSIIKLYPHNDGDYSLIKELFSNFIPEDSWASVAITGKDGKKFRIKDEWLKFQIIMRCEQSLVGINGNNQLLNNIILKESEYPEYTSDDWSSKVDRWYKWWGAKPHILDCEIFNVGLFSNCLGDAPISFINPKNGSVGLLTNCRWGHSSIDCCLNELLWICNEICDEENGLEFYVSFFNKDLNFKYNKKIEDPCFTVKLSWHGIELVPTIKVKKIKWVFKYNQNIYGKEFKRHHFLLHLKGLFRKLQKKIFYDDYIFWHDYVLFGDRLNNIIDLHERYYAVDDIITMIEIWKNECNEFKKNDNFA